LPQVEQLLFFRGVQGLSAGSGVVVGRANIRDTFAGIVLPFLSHSAITLACGMAILAGMGWSLDALRSARELAMRSCIMPKHTVRRRMRRRPA